MITSSSRTSGGRLHPTGKWAWAYSMYVRGRQFYGAAILVRQQHGVFNHVPLYLECLSLEIVLKGLLLLKDFDLNRKKLKRIGHNLETLVTHSASTFHINAPKSDLKDELRMLNKFYSGHLMRYGGLHDIFIDPCSISSSRMTRRLRAIIRLTEREFRKRPEIAASIEF